VGAQRTRAAAAASSSSATSPSGWSRIRSPGRLYRGRYLQGQRQNVLPAQSQPEARVRPLEVPLLKQQNTSTPSHGEEEQFTYPRPRALATQLSAPSGPAERGAAPAARPGRGPRGREGFAVPPRALSLYFQRVLPSHPPGLSNSMSNTVPVRHYNSESHKIHDSLTFTPTTVERPLDLYSVDCS
jgi:hypothetical protein